MTALLVSKADGSGLPRFIRGLAISAVGGGFLALTGAFGTDDAPFGLRLAYWVPLLLAGAAWGHVCSLLIEKWIDPDEQPWLSVAALTATISGPVALLVWFVTGLIFQGEVLPLAHLRFAIGPVVAITAVMSAINIFTGARQPVQTHVAPAGPQEVRFLKRLPPALRTARIIAVRSEDHYLRVHTDRGSDLIHMRLSDALDELEGLEGAQTHRSWWVARDAVRGVTPGDGRATLSLEGGIQAPVSRRYARALRESGWY